jgi:transcriptional regulator of nitric oxide reductase
LDAANTRDLVIAVAMDRARRHVILYRGTLDALAVSYDWFTGYRTGSRLVFTDVTVCDYGQTLRIGHYEVAVDALLYDHDAEYRQQAKARALMVDDTFGGSVRRLRLARGIARHAIPGVTDKTMARIERNEVRHPHIQTLRALANALSVDETELGTY